MESMGIFSGHISRAWISMETMGHHLLVILNSMEKHGKHGALFSHDFRQHGRAWGKDIECTILEDRFDHYFILMRKKG